MLQPDKYYGKKIIGASVNETEFSILFEDNVSIKIWDNGQNYSERRYITCDDDPQDLVGGKLVRIETKEGPEVKDGYGEVHEQVFVEIATDKSFINFCTHNKHNGYYSGFNLKISED